MTFFARNFPLLLALVAGGVLPVQAAFNGRLGRTMGNPALGALISFAVGTLTLAVYVLVMRLAFPVSAPTEAAAPVVLHSDAPAWMWLGGVCGAFYVTAVVVAAPRIGVANVAGLVVAGQMMVAVLLDHFALFGLPERPLSVARVVGIALVIAGVVLVQRK